MCFLSAVHFYGCMFYLLFFFQTEHFYCFEFLQLSVVRQLRLSTAERCLEADHYSTAERCLEADHYSMAECCSEADHYSTAERYTSAEWHIIIFMAMRFSSEHLSSCAFLKLIGFSAGCFSSWEFLQLYDFLLTLFCS